MNQRGPGQADAPVVSFEDVSKVYGNVRAVDGLSLDLRQGETVALLGPNGAGKSTSLEMLLALRKPTSGRIRVLGSDPYAGVKSGRVGAMLQSGGLMPEVTVRELVGLVTGFHPRPLPVGQTLRRADIADIADRRVDPMPCSSSMIGGRGHTRGDGGRAHGGCWQRAGMAPGSAVASGSSRFVGRCAGRR
jgi:ABC-2 type transport system ATP-binding protein